MCVESLSPNPIVSTSSPHCRGRGIHRHLLAPAHNPTPPLQSWTQYDFGCGPSVLEEQGTEEMNFCCVIPGYQAVCEVTSQRASSSKRGSAGPCSKVGQRRLSSGRNAPDLTPSVPRKAAGCGTYQGLCRLLLFSPIWFTGQGTDSVRNRTSGRKGVEPRASSGVGQKPGIYFIFPDPYWEHSCTSTLGASCRGSLCSSEWVTQSGSP